MKPIYLVLAFILSFVATVFSQPLPKPIRLKDGSLPLSRNLMKTKVGKTALSAIHFGSKNYVVVQFSGIPGEQEKQSMADRGITLFDYLPGNAFMAEMPDHLLPSDLKEYHATGVYPLAKQLKIAKEVQDHPNDFAASVEKLIAVSFFGTISKEQVLNEIRQMGARIVVLKIQPAHAVFVNASNTVIQKIAALPFVSYVSEQQIRARPLNYNNRAAHSLDALNAPSSRNLMGKNVTIGMGDNADPSTHVDFTGRLLLRTPEPANSHGTHTTGTAAGGGILDPKYRGMAPKATIVSQAFYDIITNAPVYLNDFDMILTNNSYTVYNAGCPDGGYDVFSSFADDQMNTYDSLLHVFASGNDGFSTCTPYPAFFGTVKSGFQCGKNILTVGASDNSDYSIAGFSSRGPCNDGRLKPEIVAGGVGVISTYPFNTYAIDFGTSMAAPTVTGALALLYERYRQLHGGVSPSAALMKAIACNSADDLGTPGPDYTFGYGMLNARTAVEAIENNHFFSGSVSNGSSTGFTISAVPAGTQQIKIMLYWSDPAAAPNAVSALVNNLDLIVTGQDAVLHHPLILNSNPANVADPAVEGIDNLNNIEQVVINNPPAGNFTITINGTSVPVGPQNFVIAYEIINPSVTVEYPFGNETWVPGESENIRWSAYGGTGNTFSVDYSLNNGSTWKNIQNNVPDANRTIAWTVPDSPTNNALIRVTRNGAGFSDISDFNFTILGQPTLTVSNPCQGYAQLLWDSIPSASSYEIMMLRGDSMQTIATTTDTTYLLTGLNKDSSYWLSVRAVNITTAGRRAIASNIIPLNGTCSINAKDFTIDSLIAPVTGRQFTSTQRGTTDSISVELRNLGNTASSVPINISYQVNGGAVVTESNPGVIASNNTFGFTFATRHDFSAVGSYNIKVWVDYPGDTVHTNDTLTATIKQLQNDPLVLAPSFTEGFESTAPASYTSHTLGFTGLDRCDFNLSDANGRVRTFVNNGFARTGARCATLDQSHSNASATSDSMFTTFNLSSYLPTDQIWLDFYYKNHGIDFSLPGNAVWIRGSDQAAWLPVLTLPITTSTFGVYQTSGGIDVTGILAAASPPQTISSSFQVKFGEQGYTSANSVVTDANLDDGFSFDDITLTHSVNDVGMVALVSPVNACALSNVETIQVKVKNYSTVTQTNIAVSYDINGTTVTETIATLAPKDSTIYSFTQKADLSAFQHYTIGVWITASGDNYHTNDSLLNISLQTTPFISTYPYLQGFETDNGGWYTDGTNDSWQWGTPAKTFINKAANGNKAWVTSLTGTYNNSELSYLYSPCFNLSSLVNPVFSFSHIFQTEDDCDCDYHWVEYSTDDINWIKLGVSGNGTNWYDNAGKQAWQLSDTRWHVSSYDVPVNAGKVRFRIVMNSDPGVTYEGIGIDDVHVFEKNSIYSGVNIDAGITQNVSGSNWVNFNLGGNIVAAINPNGQDLGSTTVKAFINTSGIRHTALQYYLDRNLVIQPTNQPLDSVSVRFYFLNTEANNLINATGCATCTTINDAYESGITQYSNAPTEEDSTLNNNVSGLYKYILPQSQVNIIPNDNGYYAEYKVTGFSEFWINNGGLAKNQPLPLVLESFTATKVSSTDGLLKWNISEASGLASFIVQKSTDGTGFGDIGTVKADSNSTGSYQFTDHNLAIGNNNYRLKIVNLDDSYQYSPVRNIIDSSAGFFINIFPNPISKGDLHIQTSSNCSNIRMSDVSGRMIKELNTFGLQNTLSMEGISKGVYMVIVTTDSGRKLQKVIVE